MLPDFDDFLLYLKTNNYSTETVYNYERDLKVFSDFLDGSSKQFSNVDKSTIAHYKAYLGSSDRKTAIMATEQEEKLASRSVNRMLSSLRSYLKWRIDMDKDTPIPPDAVKLVKTERMHGQVAELGDLVRLVEAPTTLESDKLVSLRNRAMLEVLFSTGLRISELCSLDRSQIDSSGKIFVMERKKTTLCLYD